MLASGDITPVLRGNASERADGVATSFNIVLLTVVAALFAAPAFARQSMNMTGMENTVGV